MNVLIGGTGIKIQTTSAAFENVLVDQYPGFVEPGSPDSIALTVDLTPPMFLDPDADIEVRNEGSRWLMDRGDFRASYDAANRCGFVRQSASHYRLDSVLRIDTVCDFAASVPVLELLFLPDARVWSLVQ